jgi:hypothetical protein
MMNDYMIEGRYPSEGLEQAWEKTHDGQVPPVAWEGLRARLRQVTRAERFGEFLFVLATFTMWGWYVFWFYNALQNFTIVPWP